MLDNTMRNHQASFFLTVDHRSKGKDKPVQGDIENLNPIDCSLEFLNSIFPDKEVDFQSHLLNSSNKEKRGSQTELLYSFFRQLADKSNTNLIHNADYLTASSNEKRNNKDFILVGPNKQRNDTAKFKLTY